MGQTEAGIEVIDQWVKTEHGKRRVQMAHKRLIRFKGGEGHKSDDGDAGCAQAAPPVSCPAYVSDKGATHPLNDASVFDGQPSELADLVPVDGGWDLKSYRTSTRPMFLVCKYQRSSITKTVEIPKEVGGCKVYDHAGATRAECR